MTVYLGFVSTSMLPLVFSELVQACADPTAFSSFDKYLLDVYYIHVVGQIQKIQ